MACFEVKGTSTSDLFAPQRRSKKEQYTPIKQTWDYMGNSGAAYGICSNYRHFVLVTRQFGYARYYMFDFEAIRDDPGLLGEFIGVFSKARMSGGFVERARAESDNEEKELTEEFYDLYGRTRLMLASEFESSGCGGRDEAVAAAQEFLNRLIFIFFAEDSGLSGSKDMFIDEVVRVIGGSVTANTRRVWAYISGELFAFYRDGCDDPYIFAFNGGLFDGRDAGTAFFPDKRHGEFFGGLEHAAGSGRRSWGFREKVRRAVEAQEGINPVIKNLLALASYDFRDQIRVNMLGHIFEKSLSDLEGILGRAESKRKREGVYYTPEYVTRYICHQTIIPHLSRSGSASNPHELVDEYAEDLDELDRRIDAIRILDPACGSGAFLIEAARTLHEVHTEAKRRREADGGADHGTLNPAIYDARIRRIAAENLYGIDINPQSVEIARLSLFLLTASAGEALPDLSGHIVVGDSVSSGGNSGSGGGRQEWERLFADVLSGADPGFSVVIGNPPYVRQEAIGPAKGGMHLRPPGEMPPLDLPDGFRMPRGGDLSAHFYARSLGLLRKDGRLGFISGDGWMRTGYGAALQRVMLDNAAIDIVASAGFKVFRDADVNTAVVVARRGQPVRGHAVRFAAAAAPSDFAAPSMRTAAVVPQSELEPGNWGAMLAGAPPVQAAFAEVPMGRAGRVRFGVKTGRRQFFVLSGADAERRGIRGRYLRPCVAGGDSPLLEDADAREFLLDAEDEKGELARTDDGRAVLDYIRAGERTEADTKSGGRSMRVPLPDLPTLRGRRLWYSLGLGSPPPIFVGRIIGGRPRVYENRGTYHATNEYVSYAPDRRGHVRALAAYLASSWFALHMERHANPMGGGALSAEVRNFEEAPVPDLCAMPGSVADLLGGAWDAYCADLDSERLDRAVLGALGLGDEQIRKVAADLARLAGERAAKRLGARRP